MSSLSSGRIESKDAPGGTGFTAVSGPSESNAITSTGAAVGAVVPVVPAFFAAVFPVTADFFAVVLLVLAALVARPVAAVDVAARLPGCFAADALPLGFLSSLSLALNLGANVCRLVSCALISCMCARAVVNPPFGAAPAADAEALASKSSPMICRRTGPA